MNLQYNIVTPKSETDFVNYYSIRYNELRKKWSQPVGSEKDSIEDQCIHRMLLVNKIPIGVARLQYNNSKQAQIRYMAIKKEYQRKGFGKILVFDLENIAKNANIKEIILQSRENALKFYKDLDYEIVEKTHLLFNEIQHFLMRKYL